MAGGRRGRHTGGMHTLHIEHAISDLATWQAAFARFAETRAASGVVREVIRQPVDDDHYVIIDLDFGTEEEAAAFLEILRTRVWSVPDNSPALVGSPTTRILRAVG
jgi:hypothetical protein